MHMIFNKRPAIYVFAYVDDKLLMVTVNIPIAGKFEKEKLEIFDLDSRYLQGKYGKPSQKDSERLMLGWTYDVGYIAYVWQPQFNQFTLVFDGYN